MEKAEVLRGVANSEYTFIFVDELGSIRDAVHLNRMPTAEDMLEFKAQHHNQICRCFVKATLTETDLDRLVAEMAADFKWARGHNLRPGTNFRKV